MSIFEGYGEKKKKKKKKQPKKNKEQKNNKPADFTSSRLKRPLYRLLCDSFDIQRAQSVNRGLFHCTLKGVNRCTFTVTLVRSASVYGQ